MSAKLRKILSLVLTASLLFQQIGFAQIAAELNIASHLSRMTSNIMVERFRPAHLRYFSYDALNDNFKVLVDKGDFQKRLSPKGTVPDARLQSETKTLLSYFLVGVTLPDSMFWVNLRPDSEDQIIDQYLEKTDNIGKIMLEADLQLKRDTASMTSPATPEGKEYWNKLYKKAAELFGYDNVSIPTLTRPWIVPGEIIVRESKESAYVYKANLKVMLEQDYLKDSSTYNFKDDRSKALNEYSSELIRELIIPKLTREVNSSKRYAPLRQVYYSLILARWFKLRFSGKTGTYASLINTRNLTNLISKDSWSKTDYFNQYKKSFADGEYNLKEQVYTPTGQTIRSYFSGGINVASSAINTQNGFTFTGEGISPKLLSPEAGVLMGVNAAGRIEEVAAASPITEVKKSVNLLDGSTRKEVIEAYAKNGQDFLKTVKATDLPADVVLGFLEDRGFKPTSSPIEASDAKVSFEGAFFENAGAAVFNTALVKKAKQYELEGERTRFPEPDGSLSSRFGYKDPKGALRIDNRREIMDWVNKRKSEGSKVMLHFGIGGQGMSNSVQVEYWGTDKNAKVIVMDRLGVNMRKLFESLLVQGYKASEIILDVSSKSGTTDEPLSLFQEALNEFLYFVALENGMNSEAAQRLVDEFVRFLKDVNSGKDPKKDIFFTPMPIGDFLKRFNEQERAIIGEVFQRMIFTTSRNVKASRLFAFAQGMEELKVADIAAFDFSEYTGGRFTENCESGATTQAFQGLPVDQVTLDLQKHAVVYWGDKGNDPEKNSALRAAILTRKLDPSVIIVAVRSSNARSEALQKEQLFPESNGKDGQGSWVVVSIGEKELARKVKQIKSQTGQDPLVITVDQEGFAPMAVPDAVPTIRYYKSEISPLENAKFALWFQELTVRYGLLSSADMGIELAIPEAGASLMNKPRLGDKTNFWWFRDPQNQPMVELAKGALVSDLVKLGSSDQEIRDRYKDGAEARIKAGRYIEDAEINIADSSKDANLDEISRIELLQSAKEKIYQAAAAPENIVSGVSEKSVSATFKQIKSLKSRVEILAAELKVAKNNNARLEIQKRIEEVDDSILSLYNSIGSFGKERLSDNHMEIAANKLASLMLIAKDKKKIFSPVFYTPDPNADILGEFLQAVDYGIGTRDQHANFQHRHDGKDVVFTILVDFVMPYEQVKAQQGKIRTFGLANNYLEGFYPDEVRRGFVNAEFKSLSGMVTADAIDHQGREYQKSFHRDVAKLLLPDISTSEGMLTAVRIFNRAQALFDAASSVVQLVDGAKIVNITNRNIKSKYWETAGCRGIQTDPNDFSIDNVSRQTAGFAEEVLERISKKEYTPTNGKTVRVAFAFDSRKDSDVYAYEMAKVLAAYKGFEVEILDEALPTPIAARLTQKKRLQAYDFAFHVTPSHNQLQYGGIKLLSEGSVNEHMWTYFFEKRANDKMEYPVNPDAQLKRVHVVGQLIEEYLKEVFPGLIEKFASYKRLNPGAQFTIDLMDGSMASFAHLFERLGITVVRSGLMRNINYSGKTYILADGKKVGFAPDPTQDAFYKDEPEYKEFLTNAPGGSIYFIIDGDGDRLVTLFKSDRIVTIKPNQFGPLAADYILANHLLPEVNQLVRTYVTSAGMDAVAKYHGLPISIVPVGSKYFNRFVPHAIALEESGHFVAGSFFDDTIYQLGLILSMMSDTNEGVFTLLDKMQERTGYKGIDKRDDFENLSSEVKAKFIEPLTGTPEEVRVKSQNAVNEIVAQSGKKLLEALVVVKGEYDIGRVVNLKEYVDSLFTDKPLEIEGSNRGIIVRFTDLSWGGARLSGTGNTGRLYTEGRESAEERQKIGDAFKNTLDLPKASSAVEAQAEAVEQARSKLLSLMKAQVSLGETRLSGSDEFKNVATIKALREYLLIFLNGIQSEIGTQNKELIGLKGTRTLSVIDKTRVAALDSAIRNKELIKDVIETFIAEQLPEYENASKVTASSAVTEKIMEMFRQAELSLSEYTLGYFAVSLSSLFPDNVDSDIAANILISVYQNNSVVGETQARDKMIVVLNNAGELRKMVKQIRDQKNKPVVSSAVQSAPEKAGGIDFRSLPMSIQPMGSFAGLNFKLPKLSQAQLKQINIESEMQQVKNLVKSGTVPSGDRIKELVAACAQKGEIGFYADNLLLCLADICKLQEQNAFETSKELREALVIVDSMAEHA